MVFSEQVYGYRWIQERIPKRLEPLVAETRIHRQ